MSATSLERVQAAASKLKVFPLPSVVLFPGTALPLHIFESRYRAMVADAVATDGVFAMAQLTSSGELHPMLSAGVISLHEEMPDGRSNLVLTGVCRARVRHELQMTRPYRQVEAELCVDPPFEGPEEEQLQRAVLELATRLPEEVGQRLLKVSSRLKGGALADVVASTVAADVWRRLELLSELDVRERFKGVMSEVANLLARVSPAEAEGPSGRKGGGFLN